MEAGIMANSGDYMTPKDRDKRKAAVVEMLKDSPSLAHACRKLGLEYRNVWAWKEDDSDFADSLKKALSEKYDFLEGVMIDQGLEGNVSAAREVLRGRMPSIYGDKAKGDNEPVKIIIKGWQPEDK